MISFIVISDWTRHQTLRDRAATATFPNDHTFSFPSFANLPFRVSPTRARRSAAARVDLYRKTAAASRASTERENIDIVFKLSRAADRELLTVATRARETNGHAGKTFAYKLQCSWLLRELEPVSVKKNMRNANGTKGMGHLSNVNPSTCQSPS